MSPRYGFKGKRKIELIVLAQLSHFSSLILSLFSRSVSIRFRDGSKFAVDEVNKFFMGLNSSSTDDDLVGSNVIKLEFLENISR